MNPDHAILLFFILPLAIIIIGGYVWEGIKQYSYEAAMNRERVRELHQQNHELRDENARLRARQNQ
jgi:hypothetical protein